MSRIVYGWIDESGVSHLRVSNVVPTKEEIEEFMDMPIHETCPKGSTNAAAAVYSLRTKNKLRDLIGKHEPYVTVIAWGWHYICYKMHKNVNELLNLDGRKFDRFVILSKCSIEGIEARW